MQDKDFIIKIQEYIKYYKSIPKIKILGEFTGKEAGYYEGCLDTLHLVLEIYCLQSKP